MTGRTQPQAVLRVPQHVEPKICFVTHVNSAQGWDTLSGTGCAHWVAHQKGLKRGRPGDGATCVQGCPTRVKDVIVGRASIAASMVKVGDIWATAEHCGIVESIVPLPTKPVIMIRNCSSKQGGVYLNDWAGHFKGEGKFYR